MKSAICGAILLSTLAFAGTSKAWFQICNHNASRTIYVSIAWDYTYDNHTWSPAISTWHQSNPNSCAVFTDQDLRNWNDGGGLRTFYYYMVASDGSYWPGTSTQFCPTVGIYYYSTGSPIPYNSYACYGYTKQTIPYNTANYTLNVY